MQAAAAISPTAYFEFPSPALDLFASILNVKRSFVGSFAEIAIFFQPRESGME